MAHGGQGQPSDLNVEFVLVGPQPGRAVIFFAGAEYVTSGSDTLILGVLPAFKSNARAEQPVRKGARVASSKDIRIATPQRRVDGDAVIDCEARGLRQFDPRRNPDRGEDRLAMQPRPVVEIDLDPIARPPDTRYLPVEMEGHARHAVPCREQLFDFRRHRSHDQARAGLDYADLATARRCAGGNSRPMNPPPTTIKRRPPRMTSARPRASAAE